MKNTYTKKEKRIPFINFTLIYVSLIANTIRGFLFAIPCRAISGYASMDSNYKTFHYDGVVVVVVAININSESITSFHCIETKCCHWIESNRTF